jgi:hypothetical protein
MNKQLPTNSSASEKDASESKIDSNLDFSARNKPIPRKTRYQNVPLAANGIQYNVCKNPRCTQYGQPPAETNSWSEDGPYSLGYSGKGFHVLTCNACGETPPMKSNFGIAEEIERIAGYLHPVSDSASCPNPDCPNHGVPLGTPKAYRSFGKTAQGAPRHQCGKCKKTFSLALPGRYQRDTSFNKTLFKLLVRKSPLASIVAVLGMIGVLPSLRSIGDSFASVIRAAHLPSHRQSHLPKAHIFH